MVKSETTRGRKKIFRPQHLEPGDFYLDYILLPVGYSYNAEWLKAKRGDLMRIPDGGLYRIFAVRTIKLGSAAADILSRMRYGITIKGCLQRWKMNAKLAGHYSTAVSSEECLWVIYEKEDKSAERGEI